MLRDIRFSMIRHAVFGTDSFRFAAMLGKFFCSVHPRIRLGVFSDMWREQSDRYTYKQTPHRKLTTTSTGTFVSMYKFLINALPLIIPAIKPTHSRYNTVFDDDDTDLEAGNGGIGPSPSRPGKTVEVPLSERRARLSLSAQAQLILVRKKTRRWHAALAGAVAGGMAIMWETRSRRGIIAQQMFVRCVH